MEPDELASFRASHPSPREAIAKCDRPDWIVHLGFAAAKDRKAVIGYGSNAARMLTRTKLRGPTELFVPWPGPLEAVNVWAENRSAITDLFTKFRAYGVAALPAMTTAAVIEWLCLRPRFSGAPALVAAFNAMFIVAMLFFAQLAKRALTHVVQRQAARLDEQAALRIVVERIAKGMVMRPGMVPIVASTLRHNVDALLAHEAAQSSCSPDSPDK